MALRGEHPQGFCLLASSSLAVGPKYLGFFVDWVCVGPEGGTPPGFLFVVFFLLLGLGLFWFCCLLFGGLLLIGSGSFGY